MNIFDVMSALYCNKTLSLELTAGLTVDCQCFAIFGEGNGISSNFYFEAENPSKLNTKISKQIVIKLFILQLINTMEFNI